MMDIEPVWKILFSTLENYETLHGLTHTYIFAVALGLSFGLFRRTWIEGAVLGTVSHILIDSLVHADMNPFYPFSGNPMYLDAMLPVSVVLYILCGIGLGFFTGSVSGVLHRGQGRLERVQSSIHGLFVSKHQ